MWKKSGKEVRRSWMALGALILSLASPIAVADPEVDTLQAEKEFDRGNLVGALALWRKAAEQGHAPAQAWLGYIYDQSEEDKEAFEWYRKAAVQGNAAGEFGLGEMYAKGEGVEKDPVQALSYISRAADKGNLQAMIFMQAAYIDGNFGLPVDPVKSSEWSAKVIEYLSREKAKTAAKQKNSNTSSAVTPKK